MKVYAGKAPGMGIGTVTLLGLAGIWLLINGSPGSPALLANGAKGLVVTAALVLSGTWNSRRTGIAGG